MSSQHHELLPSDHDPLSSADIDLRITTLPGELYPAYEGVPPNLVLAIAGELDLMTARAFQSALLEAIDSSQTALVLDMDGVRFFDCRGFAALVTAARYAAVKGGRVRIVNPSRAVRRLLELLGTEGVLDVDAIRSSGGSRVAGRPW